MEPLQNVYALKAINQIPRLLGNLDRNSFSPTYGCFHRDYWLDKTSDFADAIRQFGVQSLGLIYNCDFPGNIYKGKPIIRDWAVAAMDFWTNIQHADGSFDEFYPNERGWVGPTAFTAFSVIEAYKLLSDEIPASISDRILNAIQKAAKFIAKGDHEEDHLANHHAMACLAVWKAYELLEDPKLEEAFEKLWKGFLVYHNIEEGWSKEYDGVDPGYLSATISFLAKIYQTRNDPEIYKILNQSVEFCSYFVYPNGFYAGSLGSRNTLHFYPHGFELLAEQIPLAAAVAKKMLQSLADGKLVPPEIMSDRYVFYRVPEYLQAYIDYKPRQENLPPLPYEKKSFIHYYSHSGIFVSNQTKYYIIANLSKGAVVKVFDRNTGELLLNDCGLIGQLENGSVVTTQWIDPTQKYAINDSGWEFNGCFHLVPSNKLFTPLKNIVFRFLLLSLGHIPSFSHLIKGRIRKYLILGQRSIQVKFHRVLRFDSSDISLCDEILISGDVKLKKLSFGGEFFVRYVPQSRYFQRQELDIASLELDEISVARLNRERKLTVTTIISDSEVRRNFS